MYKRFILYGKLLISAGFLVFLFTRIGGSALREQFGKVEPHWLVGSFLLSAMMLMVSTWKWRVLMPRTDVRPSFARMFRLYLIGYYFTCLLPSNVGGDVVRSYYAGRDLDSQSDAAVSVFLERLTGLVVLLLLVPAAPLFMVSLYRHPAIVFPVAGALILLAGLMGLFFVRQPLRWVSGRLGATRWAGWVERGRARLRSFSQKLNQGLRVLRKDSSVGVPTMALSVLFYGLTWANVWVSFRAVGAAPSWPQTVAVLPIAMIIAMAPIAPLAGLGLAEGVYVGYYLLVGMEPVESGAMALLLRIKVLILGLLGLICYLTLHERTPIQPETSAPADGEDS